MFVAAVQMPFENPPLRGTREGEVSASYADLPSPKRSRFGFAQAGGGVKEL
jgi:hypothetical protein